jgi:predicted metal-dependent TIM-barrel fold hydrolase
VIIDHVEEHTAGMVLDTGMWAGMTLYPESKCTPARAIDILENYGTERIWMNSACDWGISVPLAVPRTILEMRKRGWTEAQADAVAFGNPLRFMSQNPRFRL